MSAATGRAPGWPAAALLSLSDRSGALEFARALVAGGTRIVASGGTAWHLEEGGVAVTRVEAWTGSPELLSVSPVQASALIRKRLGGSAVV